MSAQTTKPRFRHWRVRKELPDGFFTACDFTAPRPVTADDVLDSPSVQEWLGKHKLAHIHHAEIHG